MAHSGNAREIASSFGLSNPVTGPMNNESTNNESLLQFPCSFPVKVMGRDVPDFREHVVAIIEKHVGTLDDSALRSSPSSKGNFISLTITVDAQNQQQLDHIYQDLTDDEYVLISL